MSNFIAGLAVAALGMAGVSLLRRWRRGRVAGLPPGLSSRDRDAALAAIVGNSPAALSIKDRDGRYVLANPNLQRIHGRSEAEIVGLDDFALYPHDAAEQYRANDARVLSTLARHSIEEVVVVDGEPRTFMSQMFPVLDAFGRARFVCRISLDITARLHAEAEARKLAQAVEQNPASVILTGIDGRIEYVNPAFTAHTGHARDDVLGRDPRFLGAGLTPADTYADLWRALDASRPWRGEFINRRADGSRYVALAVVAAIRDAAGQPTHYLSIQEDITERKRIAEDLERARATLEERVARRTHELEVARDAAETAVRAKSLFLANMSHEIRTPMNAILGLAHLLMREIADEGPRARLRRLDDAARHLLGIVNDILDLSKLEAGKMTLEPGEFALDSLLDQALDMVRGAARDKSLDLLLDADAGLPRRLNGDRLRLAQALINLLSNAVRFTDAGSVRLGAREAARADGRVLLRFEVSDTGVGIAAGQIGELFTDFAQLDGTSGRRHGGTGLGLALTRRFARLMGGDTGVKSVLGKGSCFWFTAWLGLASDAGDAARTDAVPGAASDPASGTASAPAAITTSARGEAELRAHGAGRRVLVVDDNPVNREIAADLLTGAGLLVDVAPDGASAIAQVNAGHHDLVLMDVQMPGIDGLEATRRLRADGFTRLPIVAMTANASGEDRAACLAAGMNDHVGKPVDPQALFATLLHWLPGAGQLLAEAPRSSRDSAPRFATPDLDLALALPQAGGSAEVLMRVVSRFVATYRDGDPALARLQWPDPGVPWLASCHSLRGACAAIGATAFRRRVEEFELTVSGTPDVTALAPEARQLGDELAALAGRLGLALSAAHDV
ncbi:PAS domain-containing hybrid sensor histidine kinase/response regulator [Derxia gummosa]|uniref:Virulence sensor protein BvgS n=1 Tax=Derxia gummosa DSM 723 TaxID=1121388 RepID=A0A8B6X8M2_9BURK|nr:PAS domain S-box protein [Derxia gummosa]